MTKNLFENYSTKLKHILPTYFLVVICTVVLALAFRWFFSINSNILILKEEYYEIWFPFILPWIPITIWLRPKLRILKFKNSNRDTFGHQAIVGITMVAMLLTSNHYLTESNAKFKDLYSIEDLRENYARYISLEKIQLDRTLMSAHTNFRTSGKYNQHLNFDIYFVYPFKIDGILKYWCGKKYHLQVSHSLEDYQKEQRFRNFYETSAQSFQVYDFSQHSYFEVLPVSDKKEGFVSAIDKAEVYTPDDLIVIEPKKGNYSSDNSSSFYWIFGSFGIGFLVFLISLILPGYNKVVHQRQLKGIKPKSDDLVDMIKFLIPKDDHFATPIIINLNILVFLIMVISGVGIISPSGIDLLAFGGNRRTEVLNGEWWRLFTNMFLHGGIMHLFLNIFGLILGSLFIEPVFGRIKFFTIYILSGICASLASIWWYDNTISVGASGAIFGIYGAFLGLLLTDVKHKKKKGIFNMLAIYVGISLISGFTGGIDNAAHIGGLLSGIITGLIIYFLDKKSIKRKF